MNLIDRLRAAVGRDAIVASPSDLLVYECDGYTIEKSTPDVVVFPTSTEQVVEVVKACNDANVPLPAARRRHQPRGRLPAGRRRRHDRADAHEAHPRSQPS
jgi:glycolate oxidase